MISLAVPIIAGSNRMLNTELKMLILLNTAGSCTDLLMVYLLLQIPSNTMTKCRVNRTFWKNDSGQ
ncbi:hypothetical protein [Bacillus sp. SJS]|uniref:hypothetical protein n=1 Tax=Bacillus sp. SJS TaxID=1423321 RepID=UPI003FA49176